MKSTTRIIPALLSCLVLLAACASTPKVDRNNWTAEQFYQSGRKALLAGHYTRAIDRFETLEARYPYGTYSKRAQLDVAYAYYKHHDDAEAVAAASRFIRLHPTDPHVDYAYYIKGLANFNANRSAIYRLFGRDNLIDRDDHSARAAVAAFQEIVTRYPHSRYAPDAYRRMVYLANLMGQNAVDVARYYYAHGAFVAALARAKYVIEHYQQTPAIEEALGIQAMAYRQMGLETLSDDTLQVLRLNFPHSPYIARTQAIRPPAAAATAGNRAR